MMPQINENPVYDEWEEEILLEDVISDIYLEFIYALKSKRYKRQILYFLYMLYLCEEETLWKLILFWLSVWNHQAEEEAMLGIRKGQTDLTYIEDIRRTKEALEYLMRIAEIKDKWECLEAFSVQEKCENGMCIEVPL